MCCLPVNQISCEGVIIGKLFGVRVENNEECKFIIFFDGSYEYQNSGLTEEETFSFCTMHRNDPVYKVECPRCVKPYWIFYKPEPLFNTVCPDCAEPKGLVGVLTGVSSQGFGKEARFAISFKDFTCHQDSGMHFCQAREFYEKNPSCLAYQVECSRCKVKFWVFKKPILLQTHTCIICTPLKKIFPEF